MEQLSNFEKAARVVRRLPLGIRKVRYHAEKQYRRLGGGGFQEDPAIDSHWPKELRAPVGMRHHPYKMSFDLTDWMERRAYFFGHFYDEVIDLALRAALRPGDNHIDVGANIGMTVMVAAGRVGKTGRCLAFEPNPTPRAKLSHHVSLNKLDEVVSIQPFGLGGEEATFQLSVKGSHAGSGSLVMGYEGDAIDVAVRVGDDVVAEQGLPLDRPTLVKIDVEGFEEHVLRGLHATMTDRDTAILLEVSPEWLERAGGGAESLYTNLQAMGFQAYEVSLVEGRLSVQLVLKKSEKPRVDRQYDVIFLRDNSVFAQRLKPMMVS